jgi:hypothetical protein
LEDSHNRLRVPAWRRAGLRKQVLRKSLKTTIIEAIPETIFYPAFDPGGMMTTVSAASISPIDPKIYPKRIWAWSIYDLPRVNVEEGKRLAQMGDAGYLEGEPAA